MIIDIRDAKDDPISEIIFGDNDRIVNIYASYICLVETSSADYSIDYNDIDNLILALRSVQQLRSESNG